MDAKREAIDLYGKTMTERKEYFRQCWEVAEAALAQCQHERDALANRVEQADAALEHSKRFCVWSWSAYGAVWFAQCDGLAFADTRWFTHCPRCGRRINFKAKAQL